jgi:hypothetical protein
MLYKIKWNNVADLTLSIIFCLALVNPACLLFHCLTLILETGIQEYTRAANKIRKLKIDPIG